MTRAKPTPANDAPASTQPPTKAAKSKKKSTRTPTPPTASAKAPADPLGVRVSELEQRLLVLDSKIDTGNAAILAHLGAALPLAPNGTPVTLSQLDDVQTTTPPRQPLAPGKAATRSAARVASRPTPYVQASTASHVLAQARSPTSAASSLPHVSMAGLSQQTKVTPSTASDAHRPVDNIYALFADAIPTPDPFSLPTSFSEAHDPSLGEKVQVLINSATQLTSLKGRRTMPHEYIFRGPDSVRTVRNNLAELEYIYGLFRLISDPKTPPIDRRHLSQHLYQVVEDGAEFNWLQVREWSETLLTKIADGRLKWSDVLEIHSLRNTVSKAYHGRKYPGSLHTPNPHLNTAPASAVHASAYVYPPFRPTQPAVRPSYTAPTAVAPGTRPQLPTTDSKKPPSRSAVTRADTPCLQFNTQAGCTKPDGHVENGQTQGHHCTWCRAHSQRVHYHSEIICRSRKDPYNAFFQQ